MIFQVAGNLKNTKQGGINMKTKFLAVAAVLAICMAALVVAVNADEESRGKLRATLSGDSITFELTYSGLVADSLFAHIHLGQKNVAGGVMIFFCDNSNASHSPRTCPARGGTVTGTVTAADVIGPNGQGIAPGEFSKVLEAIHSGVTYVNVHSTKFPAGEIRGQVRVPGEDDDDR